MKGLGKMSGICEQRLDLQCLEQCIKLCNQKHLLIGIMVCAVLLRGRGRCRCSF